MSYWKAQQGWGGGGVVGLWCVFFLFAVCAGLGGTQEPSGGRGVCWWPSSRVFFLVAGGEIFFFMSNNIFWGGGV